MTQPIDPGLVLVVEDEDNIATALGFVIDREGLRHQRIATGVGAIDSIRTLRPAIVLLDVMLPEVSGFDICREVRADATLDAIRIVMMTARGSGPQQARCLQLGANAFLPKPFELQALRNIIRDLLPPADQDPLP